MDKIKILLSTTCLATVLAFSGCAGGWFFVAPIPIPDGDEGVSEEEVEEHREEAIEDRRDADSDAE